MMRIPYILLLLLMAINLRAQNLVPNGDFEQYKKCPTTFSQVTNYCTGWRTYTDGTSDYYNSCHKGADVGIPSNITGFQHPASGNAYAGIYTAITATPVYKEYLATTIPQLTIGKQYEVSMLVSLSNLSALGTDDMGVFFYDSGPYMVATATTLQVTPQVSYANYGPIIDTQKWVLLSKTFIADSAYDNIIIGGFKSWSTIDTQRIQAGNMSYYYIDDVSIAPCDTKITIRRHDTLICADSFPLSLSYEQNAQLFLWNTGETTPSLTVPQPGVYWRTATYRCEVYIDTFYVEQRLNTISRRHEIEICSGSETKLLYEQNCKYYQWNTNDSTESLTIKNAGVYWCKSRKNCDLFIDTFVVSYKTFDVKTVLPADTSFCKNKDYQYTIGNDFGSELSYTWNTGETTCCIFPQSSGIYTLTISNGCESSSDTMEIKMINCEDCLLVPSAFTPNKDGLNDLFTVKSRCNLTSYTIRIFDRFGEQVFTSNSLENRWNGNFKNVDMPLGVYFYVILYQTQGSNYPNLRKGDITLVR